MLLLKAHLRFQFREHLKMYKNAEKKKEFYAAKDDPFDIAFKGTLDGTLEGTPKDAFSNLHEDAQEGVFEVASKGALEVALELYLLMQLLIQKCVQNGSSNDVPGVYYIKYLECLSALSA